MLRLGPADTITIAAAGSAATTNPNVTTRYFLNGPRTSVAALNGSSAVTLLTGLAAPEIDLDTLSVANVDTQANTVTVTATLNGVAVNIAVITMQAGDNFQIDSNGKISGVNSAGQTLTQTTGGSTITFTTINAATATLALNGLAAAQGGSITMTGGTSSTSGNAGGALTRTGGAPGATGVGGAINDVGGAGGSTSGAGGACTRIGGAGTASNSAGGAIADTGGAGIGSSSGGACGQTGGAGGSTGAGGALNYISGAGGSSSGAAGAINITIGSATSGVGAAITITAGNGAGGTNGGGNINFVPGTAVSTGTPGEIQVNSAAGIYEANWFQPLSTTACPASAAIVTFFVANRAYRVKAVRCRETTVGTSETFTFHKDPSGTAAGGGTAICTGAITLGGTSNNTPVAGTMSSTVASVTMAAGDSLSFTVGGTVGSAAGLSVSALLVPV